MLSPLLPPENLSQIISNVTDLPTVKALLLSSQTLRQITRKSIVVVKGLPHHNISGIFFIQFPKLQQIINLNINVDYGDQLIKLSKYLPRLTHGNFNITFSNYGHDVPMDIIKFIAHHMGRGEKENGGGKKGREESGRGEKERTPLSFSPLSHSRSPHHQYDYHFNDVINKASIRFKNGVLTLERFEQSFRQSLSKLLEFLDNSNLLLTVHLKNRVMPDLVLEKIPKQLIIECDFRLDLTKLTQLEEIVVRLNEYGDNYRIDYHETIVQTAHVETPFRILELPLSIDCIISIMGKFPRVELIGLYIYEAVELDRYLDVIKRLLNDYEKLRIKLFYDENTSQGDFYISDLYLDALINISDRVLIDLEDGRDDE